MSAAPPPATDAAAPEGTGSANPPLTGAGASVPADGGDDRTLVQRIVRGDVLVVVLAFVFAFLIGSVLIAVADEDVRVSAGYFFARPSDLITNVWQSVTQAYWSMFRGAVFNPDQFSRTADALRERGGSGTYVLLPALGAGLKPLTETLTVAAPLIIASAGMAVGFRAGLFNIGGTGQVIVGAMAAGYVGFAIPMPPVIHLLAALVAGVVAGAVWGGIAGFLRARFGASEVITTIMLNWIATYGLMWALTTTAFTGANSAQPTSPSIAPSAELPRLLGDQFRLHAGIILAVLALVFLWWLMSRSSIGFAFRAVGSNPRAAEVAGINVGRSAFGVMVVAGGLVGLAGATQVLGTEHYLTTGIAGSIGFDAITVALLGRSGPVGILLAGLLFAGLGTGGRLMESAEGVPIDLVQVIQALVVLFIAAPPLVRAMIGLRSVDKPGGGARRRQGRRQGGRPGRRAATPGDAASSGTAASGTAASGSHAATPQGENA
ncbi:ABC transporter permease [Brachybacterium huguangmaarense]